MFFSSYFLQINLTVWSEEAWEWS